MIKFYFSVIEEEIRRQFDVSLLGRLDTLKERYYFITPERKTKHPAILAIEKHARQFLSLNRGQGDHPPRWRSDIRSEIPI